MLMCLGFIVPQQGSYLIIVYQAPRAALACCRPFICQQACLEGFSLA